MLENVLSESVKGNSYNSHKSLILTDHFHLTFVFVVCLNGQFHIFASKPLKFKYEKDLTFFVCSFFLLLTIPANG